ncbi:hypothetical protein ZYGR_0Y00140 [Zygosaccharomyces rouxii]|uniref:ZYRO0F18370p n=2 Tax=Zygosaccharomyces rouxii TaxID=4956 RepID=C5DZ57_ZYGRC|nr:uncharacterized protein ZYRO0F18370g [Zygosaccharomyces rouxii]KAH9201221.1 hypothetical protein LQ764DRAFT_76701 [Zygosaccharomyces rouxii]GAV50572.1 hypothetical protein ZYGR_0Y00140 [Zygosaccharomyces rouxii]CAQ43306.1 Uncharacterized protein YCL056C [Zygosaccharomyces rouxii]CAR29068.1 ZYRO0F18370p [Zygosaccharomyces rouxii]
MDSQQLQDTRRVAADITTTSANTTSTNVANEYPDKIDSPAPGSEVPSPDPNGHIPTFEDTLIAGLESICGLFDNVYLLKTLGIISEDNLLYRRLNKGEWGSKLWFVTLLLSARKSFSRLLKIMKAKSKLKEEMKELRTEGDEDLVKQVLRNKFTDALKKCSIIIKDVVLELLQTLAYLAIVVIEVFKINVSQKVIKILEPLSHFIAVIRIFTTGYTTLTV